MCITVCTKAHRLSLFGSKLVPCTPSNLNSSIRFNNINLLKPNVNYSGRTAPLTSKVAFYIFIQQI